jgi:hypothetical protein
MWHDPPALSIPRSRGSATRPTVGFLRRDLQVRRQAQRVNGVDDAGDLPRTCDPRQQAAARHPGMARVVAQVGAIAPRNVTARGHNGGPASYRPTGYTLKRNSTTSPSRMT